MINVLNSAYFGTPPLTEYDFYIARALGLPFAKGKAEFVHNATYVVHERPFHGPDRGPTYLAGLCVALVAIVLITITRLSIRLSKKNFQFGVDDAMVIPAALLAVAYYANLMHSIVHWKLGRPQLTLTYRQIAGVVNAFNLGGIFFYGAVFAAAASMTLFNRRVTDLAYHNLRRALSVFFAIVISAFFTAIFGLTFNIHSAKAYYSLEYQGRHENIIDRAHTKNFNSFLLYCHVAIDFTLLLIPIVVILKSQISKSLKARLCIVFALGAVHCSAAAVAGQNQRSKDISYDTLRTQPLWNLIDITSALAVVSLPVLNSLLPKHIFGSHSSSMLGRFSSHSKKSPIATPNSGLGKASHEFPKQSNSDISNVEKPFSTVYESSQKAPADTSATGNFSHV